MPLKVDGDKRSKIATIGGAGAGFAGVVGVVGEAGTTGAAESPPPHAAIDATATISAIERTTQRISLSNESPESIRRSASIVFADAVLQSTRKR